MIAAPRPAGSGGGGGEVRERLSGLDEYEWRRPGAGKITGRELEMVWLRLSGHRT